MIAGGGYIANEFAGIFNELGVDVTLVTHGDRILRSYDNEIIDRLVEISRHKGIDFRFNTAFQEIPNVVIERPAHLDFKKLVPGAIGLIRTGDTTAYGNIILESV